jgi:hypothetical protein
MRATTSCTFVMTRPSVVGVAAASREMLGSAIRASVAPLDAAVLKETETGRAPAGPVLSAQASAPDAAMRVSAENVLSFMDADLVEDMNRETFTAQLERRRHCADERHARELRERVSHHALAGGCDGAHRAGFRIETRQRDTRRCEHTRCSL